MLIASIVLEGFADLRARALCFGIVDFWRLAVIIAVVWGKCVQQALLGIVSVFSTLV